MLADDLGYGDLGFAPFTSELMGKLQTPWLKQMAKNGLAMTNFHVASPVCSPSRASIMVGLFPWRLGLDFIYAGDLKKDGSQEMDHEQLPLLPNLAMSFRDAGYYTAHIGKWHLGGQSHIDIPARAAILNGKNNNGSFAGRCIVPGINQYGFDEYVGMSEGAKSARYSTQQIGKTYEQGARYLVRNDVPLPRRDKDEILTDRQTEEAMRVIRQQAEAHRPFFVNLWFDAPHSPWEAIEPYYSKYNGLFDDPNGEGRASNRLQKYASMISNMDMNIGRVLSLVDELGIAENTLLLFTSDNGPENGAGFAGPFKGRKRLLSEGGIRVPFIVQWKGKIAPNTKSDKFALTTDLFPTLLHAARIRMPDHVRIDGMSILPVLLDHHNKNSAALQGDERLVLWYTHAIGFPKFTAAWSNGIKFMWNDYEGRPTKNLPPSMRVFDMRVDAKEDKNILPELLAQCSNYVDTGLSSALEWKDMATLQHTNLNATMNKRYAQQVLHFVNFLLIRMHLFRHVGEQDWYRYHNNKPSDFQPSCAVRTVGRAESFVWSNAMLSPEFCGDSLFDEVGEASCRCGLSDCSARWKKPMSTLNYGWEQGTIPKGLSSIAPSTGGTLQDALKAVLDVSAFKPLCQGDNTLRDAHFEESLRRGEGGVSPHDRDRASSSSTCVKTRVSIEGDDAWDTSVRREGTTKSTAWALGEFSGSVEAVSPVRLCHQRVHKRGRSVALTASGCGFDAPVCWQNTRGMPGPLPLCPSSQALLLSPSAAAGHFDDNSLLFALYDMLHTNDASASAKDSFPVNGAFERKGTTNKNGLLLLPEHTAIIDPLFFHALNHSSVYGNGGGGGGADGSSGSSSGEIDVSSTWDLLTSRRKARDMDSTSKGIQKTSGIGGATNLFGKDSGFWRHFEARLFRNELRLVIMPIFVAGGWSVSVALFYPEHILVLYASTDGLAAPYREYIARVTRVAWLTLVQKSPSSSFNSSPPRAVQQLPTLISKPVSSSSQDKLAQESGVRLLVFVKSIKQAMESGQGLTEESTQVAITKAINWDSARISDFLLKLDNRYRERGVVERRKTRAYLASMSKNTNK